MLLCVDASKLHRSASVGFRLSNVCLFVTKNNGGASPALRFWLRKKKIQLVSENNPEWKDLSQHWYD